MTSPDTKGTYTSDGTWYSPKGTPLPPDVQQRVDAVLLRRLYRLERLQEVAKTSHDYERSGLLWDCAWEQAPMATRTAWRLGWKREELVVGE